MKAFLQTKELFKLLRATYTEPLLLTAVKLITYNTDTTTAEVLAPLQRRVDLHAEWEDNNKWTLGYINLKLSTSIQQIMTNVTNARTLWNKLATNYSTTRSAGIFKDFQAVTDWKFDDRKDPQMSINELLAHINCLTADGVMVADHFYNALIQMNGVTV